MNKYIFLFFALVFSIRCSNDKSNLNCIKNHQIGKDEICLPEIENLVECSEEEIVKNGLEETNGKNNNIIGFYIPKENHSNLDSILSLNYNNYFQVYFNKKLQDKKISRNTYQEFVEMMNTNFIAENWDKIEDKMEELDLKQEVNKPKVLRKYRFNKNANCIEMVFKIDGFDEKIITVMSLIYLKKTLIMTGYYKHFSGMKSIKEAENTNEKLIQKLINLN